MLHVTTKYFAKNITLSVNDTKMSSPFSTIDLKSLNYLMRQGFTVVPDNNVIVPPVDGEYRAEVVDFEPDISDTDVVGDQDIISVDQIEGEQDVLEEDIISEVYAHPALWDKNDKL